MKKIYSSIILLFLLLSSSYFISPLFGQSGTLDPSFNSGTSVNDVILAIAIQNDGKIIIGGNFTAYNGTAINRIARLNSDGTSDATFTPGTGADNIIRTIAIQSDGKIIIGGTFTNYNGSTLNNIARLNSNGTIDVTFTLGTGANSTVNTAVLQGDGKIIIGGDFTSYNGTSRNRIARLNADGTLDATFDPGVGANATVFSTAIQSDGKIVIGGSFSTYNSNTKNFIARINSNGSFDASFAGTGTNGTIRTIRIQSDGKIFMAGVFNTYDGVARISVARANSDGSLDISFDPGTGANSAVRTSAIQSDGKILIGGEFTNYNTNAINRIARLNSDGSIDATFNTGTGANNTVWSTAIQSDGRIIIGGMFTTYNSMTRNRVARIIAAEVVVPLKLLSFSGVRTYNENVLNWETTNEINTKNFIVERAYIGTNFFEITNVLAKGNAANNYSFIDNSAQSGVIYYRLKMVDVDGRFTYSNTIKLDVEKGTLVQIFPNPVKDVLTVSVNSNLVNKYAVLMNMQGTRLQIVNINSQTFTLDLSNYSSGVYLLKVEGVEVKKIVKQ